MGLIRRISKWWFWFKVRWNMAQLPEIYIGDKKAIITSVIDGKITVMEGPQDGTNE